MFDSIKTFVVRLQNSDEATRKRWLIGLSSVSTVIVVALWVGYINIIAKPTLAPTAVSEEPSFTRTFARGLQIVFGEAKEGGGRFTGSVRELLGSESELSIERPPQDFILDTLDPIPRTSIP